MKLNEIVADYIKLRDKKQALEKKQKVEVARYNEVLKALEAAAMEYLNDAGTESARTEAGTAYRSVKISVKLEDGEIFKQFLQDQGMEHMADMRANKPAVVAYLEEVGELPPGISISRFATVNFQRS